MVRLIQGDCRAVLATLAAESVDAVVTDPPYGFGFMGREWDTFTPDVVRRREAQRDRKGTERTSETWPTKLGTSQGGGVSVQYDESPSGNRRFQAWCEEWAALCLRVLKPGGHLLACGGPRTFHRLTAGIEDAGFEIRDCLSWLFGSGFPKSLDVAKAMDRAAGASREVIGSKQGARNGNGENIDYGDFASAGDGTYELTIPATDLARQWDGWGTALKPAWEAIILARKPLIGTVAANVAQHGTGALNVDGCRIAAERPTGWSGAPSNGYGGLDSRESARPVDGRWPANVVLDEAAAAALDAAAGISVSKRSQRGVVEIFKQPNGWIGESTERGHDDAGGPSRFFYTAKSSRSERNRGLDGLYADEMPVVSAGESAGRHDGSLGTITMARNHHPTVKPVDLMRWLVRLVTPPAGLVLDPFMGSGTTGIACVFEERGFIGIERESEYLEIARRRIERAQGPMFANVEVT